jgi:hypothetical protein
MSNVQGRPLSFPPSRNTTNHRNRPGGFCTISPSDNPYYVIIRSKKAVPGINPSHAFCIQNLTQCQQIIGQPTKPPRPPLETQEERLKQGNVLCRGLTPPPSASQGQIKYGVPGIPVPGIPEKKVGKRRFPRCVTW